MSFQRETPGQLEHPLRSDSTAICLYSCGDCAEARGLSHVVELEHARAALRRASDELRGVNLDEILRSQRVAEEFAHGGLDAEDGLVRGGPQVDHAVVQPRVLAHADVRGVLLVEVRHRAGRVVDLEQQPRLRP